MIPRFITKAGEISPVEYLQELIYDFNIELIGVEGSKRVGLAPDFWNVGLTSR